jgi:hypothetical protein
MAGPRSLALVALLALGAAPAGCRRVAEKVAEKGAAAVKDTTKGLEEGLEKGRKQGASTDDAIIVAGPADLKGVGSLTIGEVRRVREGAGTEIELVVDNTSSRPLRITRLEIFAQDGKGFVKRPVAEPAELTVPPRAKDKLVVAFDSGSDKLVKARIWGVDQDLPAPAAR